MIQILSDSTDLLDNVTFDKNFCTLVSYCSLLPVFPCTLTIFSVGLVPASVESP